MNKKEKKRISREWMLYLSPNRSYVLNSWYNEDSKIGLNRRGGL